METDQEHEKFLQKLDEIINKVNVFGQLILVATKGHGKTNAMKWLARQVMQRKDFLEKKARLLLFEALLNFRFGFDKVPYLDISKARYIPLDEQVLIIRTPFISASLRRQAIMEILLNNFSHKLNLQEKLEGEVPFSDFYMLDELQNLWGRYALTGKKGEDALTVFSECRNVKIGVIGATQRLADVATQIVERSQFLLVGKMLGDNDVDKLARVLNNKKLANKTKLLKRGEFYFIDKEADLEKVPIVYFPKFEQNGKPYPYDLNNNGNGYVRYVFL